ncbi:MAG: hypothetical protein FGF48_02280 [Candidatus Brockarchaeota archaeon]|nr:hypothetical protein [Candidatus Brockarchaeota archaeon]
MRRVKGARVWWWGDDLELAGKNAETYLKRRRRSMMEECSIATDGRNENILFGIVVLAKADKTYFVTVNLYDRLDSAERTYRHSLSFVKEATKKGANSHSEI